MKVEWLAGLEEKSLFFWLATQLDGMVDGIFPPSQYFDTTLASGLEKWRLSGEFLFLFQFLSHALGRVYCVAYFKVTKLCAGVYHLQVMGIIHPYHYT